MIGMGTSNAAAGLFAGFAVSGSASRTAAAEGAGGRSQLLAIIAAVFVLITAAFLTPLFTQLPEPVLGAIVIVAVRGFLSIGPLRRYWRFDRQSFAVAATAVLGVLTFDLLPGLVIAVALSLILFIARASEPALAVLGRTPDGDYRDIGAEPGATEQPGTLVVRPDGPLFFGNVNTVRKEILGLLEDPARTSATQICLVLTPTYRLSLPVLDTLALLEKQLSAAGPQLWLVGVPGNARPALERSDLFATLGAQRVVHGVDDAVR